MTAEYHVVMEYYNWKIDRFWNLKILMLMERKKSTKEENQATSTVTISHPLQLFLLPS